MKTNISEVVTYRIYLIHFSQEKYVGQSFRAIPKQTMPSAHPKFSRSMVRADDLGRVRVNNGKSIPGNSLAPITSEYEIQYTYHKM